jgi:hypothetical protein
MQVWHRIDPLTGFCENGNVPSDLKKTRVFLLLVYCAVCFCYGFLLA